MRSWGQCPAPSSAAATVTAGASRGVPGVCWSWKGARIDARARARLEQLLAQSQQLATVYQYRERLREIWERNAPSQEALLQSLQDWCQQAEATGIQALETFSRKLRGFSVQHIAH